MGTNVTTTAPAPTPVVASRPKRDRRWRPKPHAPASGSRQAWFACAVVAIAVFLQSPGRIIPESKLDLVLNPGAFLARATHMWDPHMAFGQVSNQAVGYLFPMGPLYALGHLAHVPMWIVQRAWMALLLVVALQGMTRLAAALQIGTPGTRLVGATAYALAPAFLTQVASASAGQTAAALLPWVVLPLVRGARDGSTRRAAARSALAVVAMGAVNAACVVAVLPVPLLFLLTRERSARRRALLRQWAIAVGAGSIWWLVPLLLQWRYGQPFTQYTERASVTAATTSAFEALRGTSYWLGYLFTAGPWLPGAWRIVSSPAAIVATSGITAAGLGGLATRSMPERRFLVWCATLGTVVMVAAYGGPWGDPVGGVVRGALDGPLAVVRNVHKFDPVLRFAVCIGLMNAAAAVVRVVRGRRFVNRALPAMAVVVLALAALPLTTGALAQTGSFTDVPAYWRSAASWVNAHADGGRTLLLPASSFGEYTWGRPLDEPAATLVSGPWAVRDLVPLGSNGEVRMLDEITRVVDSGQGKASLAPALSRAGVRYLLVRNDLDLGRTGAPAPAFVRQALAGSAGITRVARFGPARPSGLTTDRLTADLGAAATGGFRAVEVYEVAPSPSRAVAYPADHTVAVSGSTEGVVDLAGQGLVDGSAVVLTGDPDAGDAPPSSWLVTDTARRQDVQFGSVRANATYTLAPNEDVPASSRAPRDRPVVDGVAHQTVARVTGAAAVRSSSMLTTPIALPEGQPFAAFDGDPASAWKPAVTPTPLGQWIEVDFEHPVSVAAVSIRLLQDQPTRPQITRLRVTTEQGVLDQPLDSINPHVVSLPRGSTRWLRMTITGVFGLSGGTNGPGITDIRVPGVDIQRPLVTPDDLRGSLRATVPTGFVFERATSDPYDPGRSDEDVRVDRAFTVPNAATYSVSGTVVARPGPALDALLTAQRSHAPVQVTASSTWNGVPAFDPHRAVDGDPATAWVAGPYDKLPSIKLSWIGPRAIASLQLLPAAGPTLQPVHVHVDSPAGSRDVQVLDDKPVTFEPLTTDQITVTVVQTSRGADAGAAGLATPFAVGIGELRVPAIADLLQAAGETGASFDLPCGQGPAVTVDGQAISTRVHAPLRDLVELKPVPFEACGGAAGLSTGEHRVQTAVDGALAVDELKLLPPAVTSHTATPARTTAVQRWASTSRDVAIGPGAPAILATTENFNAGWQASFGGQRLQAVRIDGWRQGWLVPAGSGGTVHLSYGPGTAYRFGLLLGAAAVLQLLLVAVAGRRRQDDGLAPAPARTKASWWAPAAVVCAGFAIAGPAGVIVAALVMWTCPREWLWRVAAATFAIAGMMVTLDHGRFFGSGHGAFSRPVQLLAAAAFLAVVATLADRPAKGHA